MRGVPLCPKPLGISVFIVFGLFPELVSLSPTEPAATLLQVRVLDDRIPLEMPGHEHGRKNDHQLRPARGRLV